jgi:hypothetical protein
MYRKERRGDAKCAEEYALRSLRILSGLCDTFSGYIGYSIFSKGPFLYFSFFRKKSLFNLMKAE